MKDQRKLLNNCLHNEIPAIVFQGTDGCSIEILEAAMTIYEKNGCSKEFLYDFKLLIDDFKAYQAENRSEIKLPKLTEQEKLLVREDMMDTSSFPEEMRDFEKKLKEAGFTFDDSQIVQDKTYRISKSARYQEIMGKKSETVFHIVRDNKTSALSFSIFSGDGKYPESPIDYMNFKTCFADHVSTNLAKDRVIKADFKFRTASDNYLEFATVDFKEALSLEKDIENISNQRRHALDNYNKLNDPEKDRLEKLIGLYDERLKELDPTYAFIPLDYKKKDVAIDPEEFLNSERTRILKRYGKTVTGNIDIDNVSTQGVTEWRKANIKYGELKMDRLKKVSMESLQKKPLFDYWSDINRYYTERGYKDFGMKCERDVYLRDPQNDFIILSTESKELTVDFVLNDKPDEKIKIEFGNYKIHDKVTRNVQPLYVNNMELFNMHSDSLKKLLSGGKLEITNQDKTKLLSLKSGPTGYTLQLGKQKLNSPENSAGI